MRRELFSIRHSNLVSRHSRPFFFRHSREGGNPEHLEKNGLDSRLRGNDANGGSPNPVRFLSPGQILVPSLFVFPGLILFAILIVEVAKLSQQKVLMQFAMDTAAFMEASQLSDAANRMAYLNSPWPTRVFQSAGEEYDAAWSWEVPNGPSGGGTSSAWHYLLNNGVYPGSWPLGNGAHALQAGEEPDDPWTGQFQVQGNPDPIAAARANFNHENLTSPDLGTWIFFTKEDIDGSGDKGGLGSNVKAEDVIAIYQSVGETYTYFYQIATMVKLVYEKLHGVFFKKTFWLNTGFNPDDDLVPDKVKVQDHCTSKVTSYFTVEEPGAFGIPIPVTRQWKEEEIKFGGQSHCSTGVGIWQLSTIDELKGKRPKPFRFGKYYYEGPPNHFGVDYHTLFNGYAPHVTASAEVSGGRIWPEPKPTFQVRLRP